MEPIILYIIIGAAALILGLVLGKLVFAKNTKNQIAEAGQQAQAAGRTPPGSGPWICIAKRTHVPAGAG